MANVGTVRTEIQRMGDALKYNSPGGFIQYQGSPTFDGTPAAYELFINGEQNNRFAMPTDSYVFGFFVGTAWNITDGDNPAGAIVYFGCENDGGTVAMFPTNLRATDGNEIVEFTSGVGTWAVDADDTNKALKVTFTGTASKAYIVTGNLYYSFVARGTVLTPSYASTQ